MTMNRTILSVSLIVLMLLGILWWSQCNKLEEPTKTVNPEDFSHVDITEDDSFQKTISAGNESQSGYTPEQVNLIFALLQKAFGKKGLIPNQAILKFKSPDAMRAFLKQMKGQNLRLLGQIEEMRALKIGYDNLENLRDAILNDPGLFEKISGNFMAKIPDLLQQKDRPAENHDVGFEGLGYLSAIGISGDRSTWGEGITVAVIDSGVSAYPAFRPGQITHIDLVNDGQPFNGHGTAIANLIAGQNSDAPGISPATQNIIDVRVANAQGVSDSFTLAQGIQKAVDGGAQIINISLGTYGNSPLVQDAVNHAIEHGIVVVAAAGNDGFNGLAYPAALPFVISVGASDARGIPSYFTNESPTLVILAPGVDIQSAYTIHDNAYVIWGDGTSQATAITTGVIDYLMSTGMTSKQANDYLLNNATWSKDGKFRILKISPSAR